MANFRKMIKELFIEIEIAVVNNANFVTFFFAHKRSKSISLNVINEKKRKKNELLKVALAANKD